MKNIVVIMLALVAIVGVSYWAFESLRQRSYTGENLTFEVSGGDDISLINPNDRPIAVEMHSAGKMPFRIGMPALDLQASSTRQNDNHDIQHTLVFDVPPGQVAIHVTRGSEVWFVANSESALHAIVTPHRMEEIQLTMMFACAVNFMALYAIFKRDTTPLDRTYTRQKHRSHVTYCCKLARLLFGVNPLDETSS